MAEGLSQTITQKASWLVSAAYFTVALHILRGAVSGRLSVGMPIVRQPALHGHLQS